MKLIFLSLLLLSGTAPLSKGAELGLLRIFNNFVEASDVVGQFPEFLQPMVNLILKDVRELLPEVEILLDKYNITEELLHQIGKNMNMTFVCNEVLPELDKAMKDADISVIVDEIRKHLDLSYIEKEYYPQLDEFVKEHNVSDIFDEIRAVLNITFIAEQILPEIEEMMEEANMTEISNEVNKIIDLMDVSEKLVPSIVKIMESDNITRILIEVDHLLDTSKIVDYFLPHIEQLIEDLELNKTLKEIKEFLNVKVSLNDAVDELQKLLDESNITYHVPDLKPFVDLNRIRNKLDELHNIIHYMEIIGILEEIERLLEVSYLKEQMHDLDEFLESLGVSNLIKDVKHLIESIDFVHKEVEAFKGFLKSGDLSHMLNNVTKFLDASYLRKHTIPELERMRAGSNLTNMIDLAENMLDSKYLSEHIMPEVKKIYDELNVKATIEMFLNFLNITYLEEQCFQWDKEFKITERGERISQGDLAGVVNEIVDDFFKDEVLVDGLPTTPKPEFCDSDCNGEPCGSATINSCGYCVLGSTGRKFDHGTDCNNICNGRGRIDECDVCTNPPEIDRTGRDSPRKDCFGVCFGKAVIDECGVCSGGTTGKVVDSLKDACGVCNGDGSSCAGCDGIPNSGKVLDSCQVCGGDSSSCTTIEHVHPSYLPSTSTSRDVIVLGGGLTGDDENSIRCVFDGEENAGVSINITHCRCTIPDNVTPGDKSFTVKVMKNAVKVDTKNLQIKVYDAEAVKITQMSPAELFTNTETEVVFTGNSLVSQPTAVCMVGDFTQRATFSNGVYKCIFPAIEKSRAVKIELSLNGIHKLSSGVSLARTVFAHAPQITAARFTDTGAFIHVVFDKFIDITSLTSCASIFVDVTRLGTSPVCKWSDKRHLTVIPGSGATISPNVHSLQLKNNVVKCDREEFSKFASGSKTIEAPENLPVALPVIKGPSQVSSCGDLLLDASASKGGGGRNLKYTWSLVGGTSAGITSLLTASEDKDKIEIASNLMNAGSTYTFKLDVKNFLSSTPQSTTFTVKKVANAAPDVLVNVPYDGQVTPSQHLLILAKAKAPSCSSGSALVFTWSIECTNDDYKKSAQSKVENTQEFKDSFKKAGLKIKAGALVGGRNYKVKVVVALKATPSVATTVEIPISAQWSPLRSAIVGGDRVIGRDSGQISLDAETATFDPDNAPGVLKCLWSCKDLSNDQPCFSAKQNAKITLPELCRIDVESAEFMEGKYELMSFVSKSSRTASSKVTLAIVSGDPPVVSVLRQVEYVNANQRLTLRAMYRSKIEPEVSVISVESSEYQYIDLDDKSLVSSKSNLYNRDGDSIGVMIFEKNVLSPGASYKFVISVDDGTNVASNYIIVHVRTGPTSGTLETSAQTYSAMDEFVLTAKNWVTDRDAYPLKYVFGFVNNGKFNYLAAPRSENQLSGVVPAGLGANNQVTLRLIVVDKFKARTMVEKTVVVNPITNVDMAEMLDLAKETLKDAEDTNDYSQSLPKMKAMVQTMKSAGVTASDMKTVVDMTVGMLSTATTSTSFNEDDAKMFINDFVNLPPEYIDDPKSAIKGFRLATSALTTDADTDKDDIKTSFDWINSLLGDKVDKSDPELLGDARKTYGAMTSQLADTVDIGETSELGQPGDPVVIKVAHTNLQGEFAANSGSDATKINFGSQLADSLGGMRKCSNTEECIGCKVKAIEYTEDYFTQPTSTVTGIKADQIIDIELKDPVTGDVIEVDGVSDDPIQLSFTEECGGKNMRVHYFDENKGDWSDDGITTRCVDGKASGFSDHLTAFSVAEVSDSKSSVKSYQASFVFSNISWNDGYLDSKNANYITLKQQVLDEIAAVYQGDSTLKSLTFVRFEQVGDNVKVVVKMSFDSSNTNPKQKLEQSIQDGTLGALQVDPLTLDFVEVYDEEDEESNIGLIIGITVGVAFVVLMIIAISCIIYHKKKSTATKVQSLSRPVDCSYDNPGMQRPTIHDPSYGLTPV